MKPHLGPRKKPARSETTFFDLIFQIMIANKIKTYFSNSYIQKIITPTEDMRQSLISNASIHLKLWTDPIPPRLPPTTHI